MSLLPIIPHHQPHLAPHERRAAERTASDLKRDFPQLRVEDGFKHLVATHIDSAPTLHLDDMTAIPCLDHGMDIRFYQERARLRACDGDVVATSLPIEPSYEEYCRNTLGLGNVQWLHPKPLKMPLRIAEACWEDERVRKQLIQNVRSKGLRYLHPHMGTFPVWELAALLQEETGQPIKVLAPQPTLSNWVNDKIAFTSLVRQLFGADSTPNTLSACNFAMLADRVKTLSATSSAVGIKVPNSAGGDGTLVLDAKQFKHLRLDAIRLQLKSLMPSLHWKGEIRLLVDTWEGDVICAPSVQVWIPPEEELDPIIEGIFVQHVEGTTGKFIGSVPASMPTDLTQSLVDRCWLLARTFQRLGYVGRCSFDMILVGRSMTDCHAEFLECNGRWGGTSSPMTLMNRLFGDWNLQPYVSRVCQVEGLSHLSFNDLLDSLRNELFDICGGEGRIVFYAPGRLPSRSAIDVIALGENVEDAAELVDKIFVKQLPKRFCKCV